jgi:integrase
MVRCFAEYMSAIDRRTEIPPPKLLPQRYSRTPPYLYRDEEVLNLIKAAQQIRSPEKLRAATYSTLFGLLAVTGLRVGEALALERQDVDLDLALLTIRESKGKTRLVPIHASTQGALRRYQRLCDSIYPEPRTQVFFISEQGTRLGQRCVTDWFIKLSRQIGLRGPTNRRGPRLHDLRHRFAVQTLLNWYRSNTDVEAHMPELSTYLGHAGVDGTYWYISAVPELLHLATQRLTLSKGGPFA